MNWVVFWLFLHITAAVLAFGPIFVFPIIGTLTARSPQHMRFAVELNHRIEYRLVVPFAVSMLVSGSGLIWSAGINWFGTPYLIVATILYLAAMTIGVGVLGPNTAKMLRIVEQAPSPGPGAAAGPPPQLMRLIRANQAFGGTTTVLFLVIIFLMIVQPGGLSFR